MIYDIIQIVPAPAGWWARYVCDKEDGSLVYRFQAVTCWALVDSHDKGISHQRVIVGVGMDDGMFFFDDITNFDCYEFNSSRTCDADEEIPKEDLDYCQRYVAKKAKHPGCSAP